LTAAADRPYGVRLNGVGSVNSFQNRWELQGHEKESTFGLNRVNFGARTLNPTTGFWDRIDPLAELDFNLGAYTYVGNNPINTVDLWGMKRKKINEDTYEEYLLTK
jgi:RHS repeat-associated protein